MWKIKRYVTYAWGIPFVSTVIWQTVDWVIDGMSIRWSDAMFKSPEVWCGIVSSGALFLATLIYYAQKLGALKRLPELEKKLDKVEAVGVEAAQAATGFIERAFGLQVMSDLRERYHDPLLKTLEALGFNLRNWENHVTKKRDGKIVLVDDDKKIVVWLRFMRTYYFEEAFDIKRKEIVTNGRNFCFLLLATLQAYLERIQKGEKLCYYAVTPVHPKDWYNWPHGHFKPRAYFEEDFLGLFYRTLREILIANRAKNNLIHGRYVLMADNVHSDVQRFGWPLDNFDTATLHLRETWMMPVAVPISELAHANCRILQAFHKYYMWVQERFPRNGAERLIVPLFCSSWDWRKVSKWFEDERESTPAQQRGRLDSYEQELHEAWNCLVSQTASSSADSNELVNLAVTFHRRNLEMSLEQVKPPDCFRCKEAYEKVHSYVNNIIGTKLQDVPPFIQQVHHYNVLLSEHDKQDKKQEHLAILLNAALRLRDCQLIPNPRPNRWSTLANTFTHDLHSSVNLCWLVGLNKDQMDRWYKNHLRPEFSFFGVQDAQGRVTWKLILATDLDYPFEVGRIRVIEPDDTEWEAYADVIGKLVGQNVFRFCRVQEVPEQ